MKYAVPAIVAIVVIGIGVWLLHDAPQARTASAAVARKTIEREEAVRKFNTAEQYSRGNYLSDKKKEAVRLYEEAARGGVIEGWLRIADIYAVGEVVPPDPSRVIEAWRHLEEAHYYGMEGQYAWALWTGWEVERDPAAAVRLWQEYGADKGAIKFSYWLGEAYARGEGVPRDPARALELWKVTCESGIEAPDCWHSMCRAYADGSITNRDPVAAFRWCWRLGRAGGYRDPVVINERNNKNPWSLIAAETYRKAEDARQLLKTLLPEIRARAEQGDAEAQYQLAAEIDNAAEKRQWLERAAAAGHPKAAEIVARMRRDDEARKLPYVPQRRF